MKDKIKELRIRIDGLSQLVKELKPIEKIDDPCYEITLPAFHEGHLRQGCLHGFVDIRVNSPEIEKSYDSLILAKAWLGKVLGELGQETPYKNDGKRKDIKDIEKTADTQELTHAKGSTDNHNGILNYENKTHIEKIDCLREEIKKTIESMTLTDYRDFVMGNSSLRRYSIKTIDYLSEARFWLGFELSRCRDEEK